MTIADLVSLLRTDLADPNSERFSDEVLTRCVLKSIYPVGWDLDEKLVVLNGQVDPEPQDAVREMILLQAQIEACRFMRAATANAFSFSSGDKRVDKTSQPEHWAKLEEDLTTAYNQRLNDIKPGAGDDDILTPNVVPVIYGPPRHRPWR
ncbi:MAG: hypothetical protein ABFD49_07060 [Armatimonadota bacterium]|nr:hypothetical protein [bacterium]